MPSPRTLVTFLAACALTLAGCSKTAPASPPKDTAAPVHDSAMDMHHLHGLMAHGFEMALEGATLKMLGQMQMAGAVDTTAIGHGDAMLSEGKALIDRAVSGPAMTAMHAASANDPTMAYTHDLAKSMTAVVDHLLKMPTGDAKSPRDMAMHHLHVALVHAALMASQGATLRMTASMKMAPAIDGDASAHASSMFVHARALYDETMKGEGMTAIHAGGGTGMTDTHELGNDIAAVIDQLSKMP